MCPIYSIMATECDKQTQSQRYLIYNIQYKYTNYIYIGCDN